MDENTSDADAAASAQPALPQQPSSNSGTRNVAPRLFLDQTAADTPRQRHQQLSTPSTASDDQRPNFFHSYSLGDSKDRELPSPNYYSSHNTSVRTSSTNLTSFISLTEVFQKKGYNTAGADYNGSDVGNVNRLDVWHYPVIGEGGEERGILQTPLGMIEDPNNHGQFIEREFGNAPLNASLRNAREADVDILSTDLDIGKKRAFGIITESSATVDCLPIFAPHDFANSSEHDDVWELAKDDRVEFLIEVMGMFPNLRIVVLHGAWALQFFVENKVVLLRYMRERNIEIPHGLDTAVAHASLHTSTSWNMDMVQARTSYEALAKSHAYLLGREPLPLDINSVVDVYRKCISETHIYCGYYGGELALLGHNKENIVKLMVDAGMTGNTIYITFPSKADFLATEDNSITVRGLKLKLMKVKFHNLTFGVKNETAYGTWKSDHAGDQDTVREQIDRTQSNRNNGEVEEFTDDQISAAKDLDDDW